MYGTLQNANNKGADQTTQMGTLLCDCVVRKIPEDRFSRVEAHILLVLDNTVYILLYNTDKAFTHVSLPYQLSTLNLYQPDIHVK